MKNAHISDAMVDAYLAAQREAVEEVDRYWGGPSMKCAAHLHPVREACRAGLAAALTAAPGRPVAPSRLHDAAEEFVHAYRDKYKTEGSRLRSNAPMLKEVTVLNAALVADRTI